MAEQEKKRFWKTKTFWIIIAILFLLVLLTAIFVCARLGVFTPERKQPDYIALVPTEGEGGQGGGADAATDPTATETEEPVETFIPMPQLQVNDHQKIWSTYTEVEIFKASYENGEEEITVLAADEETHIVAPGTENSYTFRLLNTGNVPLDYTVLVGAKFSDGENEIPVEVRLRDYNGSYMVGSRDTWKPVLYLNGVEDNGILGINHYAYYTLDWRWVFERGETEEEIAANDEYDTFLGNWEEEGDYTLTIMIRTIATPNLSEDAMGGLPATGDSSDLVGWYIAGGCAVAGLVVLLLLPLVWKRKEKKEEAETPNEGEDIPHEGEENQT